MLGKLFSAHVLRRKPNNRTFRNAGSQEGQKTLLACWSESGNKDKHKGCPGQPRKCRAISDSTGSDSDSGSLGPWVPVFRSYLFKTAIYFPLTAKKGEVHHLLSQVRARSVPFQMSCWAAPSTQPRWTCGAWAASSWRWWPECRRFREYVIPTTSWTRYSNCSAHPPRTRGPALPTFPATSRTSWVSNWANLNESVVGCVWSPN